MKPMEKEINKHLETIMKFRNEPNITNDDFRLLLDGFKDICISYGRLDHAKNDDTLENVVNSMDNMKDDLFESFGNIFKPDNQN